MPRHKPKVEQPHYFYQLLHHLGWSLSALEEHQPLLGLSRKALWQAAPLPDGQALLIVIVAGELPNLDTAFQNYEDLTPLHRELQMAAAREGLSGRHMLMLDEDRNAQLYDLAQEDVLIAAQGTGEVEERLLPLLGLNALARGSLNTFPRKSLRQRSHELNDWTKVWSARIGAAADTSRDSVMRFFFWLHLARLAEQLKIGPEKKVCFSEYAQAARPPHPVRFVMNSFKPLRETWNLLQGQALEIQQQIAQRAHARNQLQPCLASYSYLSRSKFAADIFAEAFADEELRLTSWRYSLTEPEERSPEDLMRWMVDPLVVELDKTGFAGVLRGFDRVTEDLRMLAREQAVARERGERPGMQLDLLGTEPPPIQEEDAPRLALQRGVKVKTSRRDRGEIAKLVLLSHAAEWNARLRRPDPIYPSPQVIATESVQKPKAPAPPADPSMN